LAHWVVFDVGNALQQKIMENQYFKRQVRFEEEGMPDFDSFAY
jgi:hypothetical protein